MRSLRLDDTNQEKFPLSATSSGGSHEPIYVTRPYLPPLTDLIPMLEQIWERRVLTNGGPFHALLETQLQKALDVDHVSLVTNGMLGLTVALDAAGLSGGEAGGEVITTPYSFIATSHVIRLADLTPVFVDVRASDLNIDPERIEAAITPRTRAIVAVHCYGNPCDVDAIRDIAGRHGLKVIYDAAHAFGVNHRGRGLLRHGDFSVLSFHATKAFNTFEGGAVISATPSGKASVDRAKNFGIMDELTVTSVGINAKMSEFNAALGLLQLDHFEHVRSERRRVDQTYRELLVSVPGITCLAVPADVDPNFSYFPVLVGTDYPLSRDHLYDALKVRGIYARRYFYPLLSSFSMYSDAPSADRANLPVAHDVAEQILCLPIFPDLSTEDQHRIVDLIASGTA
jgi:dTDP-4-amino-4,6-dideoxygalactose transaminase